MPYFVSNDCHLSHFGISGQKWGVRRYQNPDGTLTEAGKARYGDSKEYADTRARMAFSGKRRIHGQYVSKDDKMISRIDRAVNKNNRRIEKAEASGNTRKADRIKKRNEKLNEYSEYYKTVKDNTDAYNKHTSTRKMVAQNVLMGHRDAEKYRRLRAMGNSRGKTGAYIAKRKMFRHMLTLGTAAATMYGVIRATGADKKAMEWAKTSMRTAKEDLSLFYQHSKVGVRRASSKSKIGDIATRQGSYVLNGFINR